MSLRRVLIAQGAYYTATGVAPFVSRRAFEAVTGPKQDWWLVETVGAIVTPVGLALLSASRRDEHSPEIVGVAAGCALGLGAVDVVYASRGRIAPSYFADAAIQAVLLAGLAIGWSRRVA